MLPKEYRLHDYQEIERVKKEGKLFQSPLFGVLILEKTGQPVSLSSFSRFAFIVSKKVSTKAIERNRIKRVLSESVRLLLPAIKPDIDGVFLGKRNIIGKNKTEIKQELENVFRKAKLLKEF